MRAVLLALSFSLLSLPSLAEPSYYTWVDAQGVVHNTLVNDEQVQDDKPQPENPKDEVSAEAVEVETDTFRKEAFKTEEEFQQNIKEREDKPFYTWTDADGTIRNNEKPDVFVEFTSTEVVYDAVFAPPFRLPVAITEGLCCSDYQQAFTKEIIADDFTTQKISSSSLRYKTQSGVVPAAYFIVPQAKRSIVFIKAFKLFEDTPFDVVALNEKYKPLYLSSNLNGVYVKQTWKDLAYNKIMLEIADPEVRYLIIFSSDDRIDFEKGYSLSVLQGPAGD